MVKDMEILLHGVECPYDYDCKHPDCMECMKIHMEEGGEDSEHV